MIRLAALILALGLSSCTDRQHRNPLDPRTTNPEFFLEPLRVLAGDGRVSLYWDFSEFDDITGFQLYRRIGAGDFSLLTSLDATAVEFEDTKVENAMTYHYQLALLVADEGEILLDRVLSATPGLEVCWVGDLGAATIWRGSIVAGGTPCLPYMLLGEELRVRISDWETDPQHPSPEDAVVVRVHLTGTDLASSPPHTVTLMWENTICEIGASAVVMSELPGRRVLGAAHA